MASLKAWNLLRDKGTHEDLKIGAEILPGGSCLREVQIAWMAIKFKK